MRTSWLILAGAAVCIALAATAAAAAPAPASSADPAPAPSTSPGRGVIRIGHHRVVRLDEDALQALRSSDPGRYAAVHRILTSASRICSFGAPAVQSIADAHDVGCQRNLWKTSLPPKRELHFVIGDTFYIAEITVRDLGARITPVLVPAR